MFHNKNIRLQCILCFVFVCRLVSLWGLELHLAQCGDQHRVIDSKAYRTVLIVCLTQNCHKCQYSSNCCIDLVQSKWESQCVLCDIDNLLLKVIWKCKALRIFKTTLRKKYKVVGLIIARNEDLQIYGNQASALQQGKRSEPIKQWRAQKSSGKLWELWVIKNAQ